MKRFKKNKNCLEILNSKNTVSISYNSKESKISFETFNDGYTFCDIENFNNTKIEFEITEAERDSFLHDILEELEIHIFDYGPTSEDED
jgi:hypothetical protein